MVSLLSWRLVVFCLFSSLVFTSLPVAAGDQKPDAVTETPERSDPLESINRFTFGFNQVVRDILLDPLVDGYQAVTPEFMQEAIGNAASNLTEPVTAISSFLQGDTENAGVATKRFLMNSTLGIGGLNDPATEAGLEQRREYLGQAAAVNGADEGLYIVLPILGPSNSRDALGDALTAVASPLPLIGAVAQGGVQYSGNQDDIQAISKSALDPYIVERDAYSQYRKYQINNGNPLLQDGPTIEAGDLQ